MKITITIDKIETWYRESDKRWVIFVSASSDHVSMGLSYSGKKLNDTKRRLVKNLPNDLLKHELIYLVQNESVFKERMKK